MKKTGVKYLPTYRIYAVVQHRCDSWPFAHAPRLTGWSPHVLHHFCPYRVAQKLKYSWWHLFNLKSRPDRSVPNRKCRGLNCCPPPSSVARLVLCSSWRAVPSSQLVYYLSASVGPTVAVRPLVHSEALHRHLELSLHCCYCCCRLRCSETACRKPLRPENMMELTQKGTKFDESSNIQKSLPWIPYKREKRVHWFY